MIMILLANYLEPLMQSEKFIEWENGFGHGGAGHLKQHYEHKP